MTRSRRLVIGLMSGTSLDGIDAALVDFSDGTTTVLCTRGDPFSPAMRHEGLALQTPLPNEIHRAAKFSNALAQAYADTVHHLLADAGLNPSAVEAIGCHGQTIRHQPAEGYTVQLVNAALLAELTDITVVADFRSRDIAAGGQGAPLVPAYHAAVFGSNDEHRVILNLGGIGNVTDLPLPGGNPIRGFDTGPGNLLLDAWIERHLDQRYDASGQWARQGQVLPDLLERLLADPYFATPPPKSCGREDFGLDWLLEHLKGPEVPEDVQATLAELTAISVAQASTIWCAGSSAMYVCGGGSSNEFVMDRLRHHLPQHRIASTAILGQPPDWVEAAAFAWLAWQLLNRKPGNLPTVTGARGKRILGAIYPA